jgi:2-hydroxychromene-2-carboxylate isomerase
MTVRVDYYLSLMSIWSYIGHDAIHEMAAREGIVFNYKPLVLGSLFEQTGGTPLRKRHLARQRYRDFELQRWCRRRGVVLDLGSPYLLADKALGDCVGVAIAQAGGDAGPYFGAALRAVWTDRKNIADPAVVAAAADSVGLDGSGLVARAASDEIQAIYARNLVEAVEANVFGTPGFVLHGEVFWGQDRLDFLAEAVREGRPPYKATV